MSVQGGEATATVGTEKVGSCRSLDPRRILMTVDAVGGVWRYAMDLGSSLREAGVDVIFYGFGPPPDEEKRIEARRIGDLLWSDAPLDWTAAEEGDLDVIPSLLRRAVEKRCVDLVHLNLPSQAYRLDLPVPVIAVAHSCVVTWFRAVRHSSPPPSLRWHEKRTREGMRRVNAVVTPSRSHADMIAAAYGPLDRLHVVYNSVHPLSVERQPLHQIYNLACPASPPHYQADPMHTMMTSVEGTRHMLELAQRHQARFLQASTSEIYGDPLQHPQQEEYLGNVNCTGPRACYDEGKRAAESMCFDMLRSGRVDARVVRIFNTYGPRMRPDNGRIISNFIVQALENKPLTVYGSGEQTRSFCYVTDLVGGLVAMMSAEPNPGVAVNLGNPGEFTVKDLADFICSLVATTSKIEHEPLPPDDPQRRRPDITRAREILGWSPVVSLAEGLPPTIDWFSQELQDREWQTSPLASGLSEPQEAAE
jgi:UDP-glucuronate decarboxylase